MVRLGRESRALSGGDSHRGLCVDASVAHVGLRFQRHPHGLVVRDYLVKNFRMDDTRVKTMALGKSEQPPNDAGIIEITIYPAVPPSDPRKPTTRANMQAWCDEAGRAQASLSEGAQK